MKIVLIEWDGAKAPSTFYQRMHNLGLFVRGDVNLSPLERRVADDGHSVIVQEGAIICASESLARQVYLLAQEHGAKVAIVGDITIKNDGQLFMTKQDLQTYSQIEQTLGRRGRPPTQIERDWVVACLEEGKIFPVMRAKADSVLNCPSCHGFRIRLLEMANGVMPSIQDDVYMDTATAYVQGIWVRARFFMTHEFMPLPIVGQINGQWPDGSVSANYSPAIQNQAERQIVQSMGLNFSLKDMVEKMSRDEAFEYLDAIFLANAHLSNDTRMKMRAQAIVEALMLGADPSKVNVGGRVDIFDAAAMLGVERVAEAYMKYK